MIMTSERRRCWLSLWKFIVILRHDKVGHRTRSLAIMATHMLDVGIIPPKAKDELYSLETPGVMNGTMLRRLAGVTPGNNGNGRTSHYWIRHLLKLLLLLQHLDATFIQKHFHRYAGNILVSQTMQRTQYSTTMRLQT